MNYRDVFFHSRDGLRLYARDYPGPHANAAAIVCLPGLTRNSKDFAALAEALQATHRVICPDLRGRGRSQTDSDTTRYRPDQYAEDIITLMDLLLLSNVYLIGTSLGGLVSFLLLAREGARIAGAVINDIGPEIDPVGLARIASYAGKSAAVNTWDEAARQTAAINGGAFPEYCHDDWLVFAQKLYVQIDRTPTLDYDPHIADAVESSTANPRGATLWPLAAQFPPIPMLVIRGELSDILSATTLRQMEERIPKLTAVTIPGRGHAPSLDEPAARDALWRFFEIHNTERC